MHFPGGSNTRKNPLAYKYTGKKSTDFRLPRGLQDGSQRWNWRNVRLVTSTKFCSFVLQTLRRSVRSFYKLYDALFAYSTKMNVCSVGLIFNWTWLWPVLKHPCYLDGPCILKRYFTYQIISVIFDSVNFIILLFVKCLTF